jgi:hypothetical protein
VHGLTASRPEKYSKITIRLRLVAPAMGKDDRIRGVFRVDRRLLQEVYHFADGTLARVKQR